MNILIDRLPTKVKITGVEYPIRTDFRTSILFELMMADMTLDDNEKLIGAMELYYPVIPDSPEDAFKKILWFYKGGKEEKVQRASGSKRVGQIYSFDYDDDYIYAAFLDQYKVDLQDVEYLHWWKFKAMFKALKEDNEIVRIMGYRAVTIDSKMPKEQQKFYRQMQERYKIPMMKSEQDKLKAVEDVLLNGGDLSGVL